IDYLKTSGRAAPRVALVEKYAKAQGLWHEPGQAEAQYSAVLHLDLGDVKPSLAGPKRPQDRVLLQDVQANARDAIAGLTAKRTPKAAVE
ncbi:aconitase family protein, partial [Acinetobacter baumannii]